MSAQPRSHHRRSSLAAPVRRLPSTTTSCSLLKLRPNPSSPERVISIRPHGRSRLAYHKITTSAKVRWMAIPITRCISCSFQLRWTGAVGDTTTTDPRSRRNRVGRRGGQLLTRALGSLYRNGLPTDVLPVPLVPGWSHHTPGPSCPSRMSEHRDPHTSYQRYRAAAWRVQATDQDADRTAIG
jgi:hypothetical protein